MSKLKLRKWGRGKKADGRSLMWGIEKGWLFSWDEKTGHVWTLSFGSWFIQRRVFYK